MRSAYRPSFTDFNLVAVAFIWALNFSVIKASLTEIDPYTFNSIRFLLASLFIWIVLIKKRQWFRIHKADWLPLTILGLSGNLLYQWLFIVGIDLTFAANAAVMLGTIPIWVALFSHIFSFEMLNRVKTLGVLLAFLGVAMIIMGGRNPISFSSGTFTGDLTIIAAAVVWGLYTIYSKQFLSRYTPLQFSAVMTSFGGISLTLLAISYSGETDWRTVSIAAYGGIVYSGLLAIGLAYLIWNNGLLRVGAVRTSTYQNLVPVLGLIFGVVLLKESLVLFQYVGSAIVITGIILTRYGATIKFARRHSAGRELPSSQPHRL